MQYALLILQFVRFRDFDSLLKIVIDSTHCTHLLTIDQLLWLFTWHDGDQLAVVNLRECVLAHVLEWPQ